MKRGHQQIQRKLALPGGAGKRQPWAKLVDAAMIEARKASGESYAPEAHGPMRGLTSLEQLRLLRRDCRAADWPVEGVSSTLVGEAFLKVVDAFAADATASATRGRIASLLKAAAEVVLDFLDDANTAEAVPHAYWMDRD